MTGVAIATALAAVSLLRARFSPDLTDLLPHDSRAAAAFRTWRESFGQSDQLVLAAIRDEVESEVASEATPSPSDWLASIRPQLEERSEVRAVSTGPLESLSLFAEHVLPSAGFAYLTPDEAARLRDTLRPEGLERAFARSVQLLAQSPGLDTSELVRRDPLFLREILAERAGAFFGGANGPGDGSGGAEDLAVLVVTGHRPAQDLDASRALVAAVDAEIAALGVPSHLRLLKTGGYMIAVEDSSRIRHDLTASTGSSVALVLTLFFLGFRGLWPLVFAAVPLLLGIAWAYGLFVALRGGITMLTAVGPAMLVGLGDFGVHLYAELKHARAEGMTRDEARRAMLARTGPRLALAALTSASCFLAFGLTGFRGLADLGLLAGMGLLCCLVAFLVLFPILVARHDPPLGRAPLAYATDAVAAGPLRFPRGALAIAAAITLAAAGVLATRGVPEFTTDARLLHPKHSPAFDALAELDRRIERPLVPWVVLAEGDDPAELAERFARLDARLAPLRERGDLVDFELPTRVLPPREAQLATLAVLAELDPAATARAFQRAADEAGFDPAAFAVLERSIEENLERAARRAPITLDELHRLGAGPLVETFFRRDDSRWIAAGYLFPRGALLPGPEQTATIERVEKAIDAEGADGFALTGFSVVAAELSARVQQDFRGITGLAAGVVVLLVLLGSRSLRATALALLPVATAFVWLLAAMQLAGMRFNVMNVVILPMLVGSGIECGIHLVFAPRHGSDVAAAIRAVLLPMSLSALTNIAGFGSLATVDHPAIASMGTLTAAGMSFTLLAALLILLPLLKLRPPRA